jgi:CBS domain-containing protein
MRFIGTGRLPGQYVKSHARYARDIMTQHVITVAPDTALPKIAALFEKTGIKRVPVVQEGQVVGILSRSDLVRAFAATIGKVWKSRPRTDETIRCLLSAELERQAWWRPEFSNVAVDKGVVTFGGFVELDQEKAAARVAAESIPGVREVIDARLPYQNLTGML